MVKTALLLLLTYEIVNKSDKQKACYQIVVNDSNEVNICCVYQKIRTLINFSQIHCLT